jgi:hypothetical protein
MPKLSDKPLTRICIRVYADDYNELRRMSGTDRQTNLLIRTIVQSYVRQMRDKVRAYRDGEAPLDIPINLEELTEDETL